GLGVLGWGVGGIEAEAAMLGQPMSMLIPQVLGFRLHGELPEGATATDLVLTVTEMLRRKGVVGKIVEFYGPGVSSLPLAARAKQSFRSALADLIGQDAQEELADAHDEAVAESFPASDPPANSLPGSKDHQHEKPAPAVGAGAVVAERSESAVPVRLGNGDE